MENWRLEKATNEFLFSANSLISELITEIEDFEDEIEKLKEKIDDLESIIANTK